MNPKKMWKIVNEIAGQLNSNNLIIDKIELNNETILKDNISILNEFNNFFTNAGKNVEYSILNNVTNEIKNTSIS